MTTVPKDSGPKSNKHQLGNMTTTQTWGGLPDIPIKFPLLKIKLRYTSPPSPHPMMIQPKLLQSKEREIKEKKKLRKIKKILEKLGERKSKPRK